MQPNCDTHPRKACLWMSCTAATPSPTSPPPLPPQMTRLLCGSLKHEWEKPLRFPSDLTCRRMQIIVCLYCSTICMSPFWYKLCVEQSLDHSYQNPIKTTAYANKPSCRTSCFPTGFWRGRRTSSTSAVFTIQYFPSLGKLLFCAWDLAAFPKQSWDLWRGERKRQRRPRYQGTSLHNPLIYLSIKENQSAIWQGHHTRLHNCSTSRHTLNFIL